MRIYGNRTMICIMNGGMCGEVLTISEIGMKGVIYEKCMYDKNPRSC